MTINSLRHIHIICSSVIHLGYPDKKEERTMSIPHFDESELPIGTLEEVSRKNILACFLKDDSLNGFLQVNQGQLLYASTRGVSSFIKYCLEDIRRRQIQ